MPIVLKSGRINLLDPSGPAQAFTGIVLPLPFISHFVTVSSPREPDEGVRSYRVPYVSVRTLLSEDDRSYRRRIVVQNVPKLICQKSNRITLLVINNTSNRCVSISLSSPIFTIVFRYRIARNYRPVVTGSLLPTCRSTRSLYPYR